MINANTAAATMTTAAAAMPAMAPDGRPDDFEALGAIGGGDGKGEEGGCGGGNKAGNAGGGFCGGGEEGGISIASSLNVASSAMPTLTTAAATVS